MGREMAADVAIGEFDQALRKARTRLLQRRLMVFCIFYLLIWLVVSTRYWPTTKGGMSPTDIRWLLSLQPEILLYVVVLTLVYIRPLSISVMQWMAAGLVVGVGLIDVLGWLMSTHDFVRGWALAFLGAESLRLLIASVFIPWTFREALYPAAALLLIGAAVATISTTIGGHGWREMIPILFMPPALVPSLLNCQFRYKRFLNGFRLRFESMRYHDVQEELVGARRIHETCLPAPKLEGRVRFTYAYEPMREIGGDFLFAHVPENRPDVLTLITVDVMGHGIAAALSVNRLFGELERIFGENPDTTAGQTIRSLNRYINITLARHGMFATAFCLRLDASNDLVSWAGGGHPAALLRRFQGDIVSLESQSAMLGVQADDEFSAKENALPLQPGDAILSYTDGAEEARDQQGCQLGAEGIKGILSTLAAAQSVDGWPGLILDQVSHHRAGPAQDDTLLAVAYVTAAIDKQQRTISPPAPPPPIILL